MRHTPGAYAVGTYLLLNRRNRGLAPLLHRDAVGRRRVDQRDTDRQIPVVVLAPDADTEPR